MKANLAQNLQPVAHSGNWVRMLLRQHASSALSTSHTRTHPGRFNTGTAAYPDFEVLYLAESHLVAQFEVSALLGSPAVFTPSPLAQNWLTVHVNVNLAKVVDLTSLQERRIVLTSAQELTGDWRSYYLRSPNWATRQSFWKIIPTQRLARAIFQDMRRIEGIITYSARVPDRKCLVVFPHNLRQKSSVVARSATDSAGAIVPIKKTRLPRKLPRSP